MQKRRHSLLESCLNTASGFILSYICGLIIFPLFGFAVGLGQNAAIVAVFTVISVARNYAWRRTFNWWHHAKH